MRGSVEFGLVLFLAVMHSKVVECQSCPSVLSAIGDSSTSCVLNNCSSLSCAFPQASQLSGNVTFRVENCTGPVRVDVAVAIAGAPLAYKVFQEPGGFLHLALGRSVKVVLSRNASYLFLEVEYKPVTANATFSHPVVPPVQVPLSPTECMCKSLEQTAQSVQMNSLVHTCETSAGCTGVRCRISALGQTGYVETIILPCQQALDVLVEDESFTPVSRQVFYRTESRNLNIRGNSIRSDVTIIPRDYSMDIALSVYQFFLGTVPILTMHTIILDKTNCSTPNLTTSAPPPAPTPSPPPDPTSPALCSSLYNGIVRQNYTEPFICSFLRGSCDAGVSCTLLLFGSSYRIDISVNAAASKFFSYSVVSNSGSGVNVTTQDKFSSSAMLPSPRGSELLFGQASISKYLKRLQINLHLIFENEEYLDVVLPLTTVSLRYEPCQAIKAALLDASTDCSALGDCSGLSCSLGMPGSVTLANDVTVEVDKCRDPVVAKVTVVGASSSENNVTHDDMIYFGGGESLAVKMSRNATVLNFTASFMSQNSSSLVIPPVFIPLNASMCMCQSLRHLARVSGHTYIETNCDVNQACNGVRCELDILGSIYYLETVVLPCEDAVEWLVEDEAFNVIAEHRFYQSEQRDVVVANLPLTVDVTLVKHIYSIDIHATLVDPLFGEVEIVPMTTIILDRTDCSHQNFTTVPPPHPVMPPTPPTSDQSETCAGFYKAIRDTTKEPFTCQYYESCDVGVKCLLKILNSSYIIIIAVADNRTSLKLSVSNGEGKMLLGKGSSDDVTVALSNPARANLTLSQTYNTESESVGMQLELNVYSLSGQLRTDVLIPYTEVVIRKQSPPATKSPGRSPALVAVPVVIIAVVVAAAIIIVGVVIFLVVRNRRKAKQFDFQRMSPTRLNGKGVPSLTSSEVEEEEKRDEVKDMEDRDSDDDDGFKKVDLGNTGNSVQYK